MKTLSPDNAPEEPQPEHLTEHLPNDWLPIREVARQTGVNAVTLRAWERRYGLIVPHRTAKGHRLYSDEHVQRVMAILTWLDRGVAVSQVKALLDSNSPAPTSPGNDWEALRQSLIQAISELAERRIDDLFNRTMSLYPPRTLCEQLLLPLLADLEQRWQSQFGSQMERMFFHSWLRSKFGARIYHNNRQLNGPVLLLVNQSDRPMEPHLWLAAWLISSADCPVEVFDGPLPVGELALACEYLSPRAVLLYASKTLSLAQLPKLLGNIHCPILLSGPAVVIHHDQLPVYTDGIANLSLTRDSLEAYGELNRLGLI